MNRPTRCLAFAAALVLCACDDSRLDVDLYADDAGRRFDSIFVTIDGVVLERDGSIETLEVDRPERIDLLDATGTSPIRLLDGEMLSEGQYTSVRLRFLDEDEDDNYLVEADGSERELVVGDETDEVPVSFTIEEDEGRRISLALSVDALLSLAPRGGEDDEDYDLDAVLRAALEDDAATLSGSVAETRIASAACSDGRPAGTGVAVYLFDDLGDTEPDDYDAAEPDPIAAAPVTRSGSDGTWTYRLRVLEAGDYTLALTCNADIENPSRNDGDQDADDFDFVGEQVEVSLDAGDDKTADLE